jgi:HAE1 family hydrophobic/amphiphilic exporter-1
VNFFALFIRRHVMTTVLVLIAVILGVLSYLMMGLRRFPDVEFPMVTVTTLYSGGSPEEVESEITRRIEEAVSSIAGIDEIRSFSQQGISQVIVQFELEEDVDLKAVDVRNNIDDVLRELPDDAEDPVVDKFEVGQEAVLTLALTGPQDINALYRLADESLSERLSQVSGVSVVTLTGGREREIEVLLKHDQLRRYGLSIRQVVRALERTNRDVPAGYVTEPSREYLVRVKGRFADLDEIEGVRVPTPSQGRVEIRHLGRVADGHEDRRTASRYGANPAVIVSVQKQSKANDVEVVDAIRAILPELRTMLPSGARLDVVEDQSEFVRGALANVQTNMLLGIVLTALALYLFLGSWRATVIAAVVIPTALVTSFTLMAFSGFSLNILTLLALALSVGIIVNNSILILENSVRMLNEGRSREDAAAAGAADIALPVFSTAATNLVVFIPIAFMGEIIGRFFREFGLTIVYVTLASFLISFTLTPMMCGRLLVRNDERKKSIFDVITGAWQRGLDGIRRGYLKVLSVSLRHPGTALLLWVIVLAVTIFSMGRTLGGQFFPETDEGRFKIQVQAPAGVSLGVTENIVRRIERVVKNTPHLRHYYSRIGRISGFLGGSNRGVNLAEIGITVSDRDQRDMSLTDIIDSIRGELARIPGAGLTVVRAGGGPRQSPVQVEISGDNLEEIRRMAARVMSIVETVPGTAAVDKSWQSGQPELRITPTEQAVGMHGFTVGGVARAVRSFVDGQETGEYRDGDEHYDIRVRLQQADRERIEDMRDLFIRSPETGEMLRLGQVAEIRYEAAPTLVTRKDRRRYVSVTSELTGARPLTDVVNEIRRRIREEIEWPADMAIAYGGETELMRKNFRELFQALGTAAVLTFLCTAGIIESFLFAGVIVVSLPLSLIGVFLAMFLAGVQINVFSLMAMIMLVGMVVNNAIIIVDYAMRPQFADRPPAERITQACRVRYRVIVMANTTTVAAMIPLSLGLGFGGEIFRPIAVVEIGGILAAAVLSLLVIPVVYLLIERYRTNAS